MSYLIIRTVAVLITSYITKVGVPLTLSAETALAALVVAIVIAVINHTIKPMIEIFTLPINILTLGFFSLFVNGIMILLAESIVRGLGFQFLIPSLLMAIWFSIVLTVVNWVLHVFE